jgi:hypothetical protein
MTDAVIGRMSDPEYVRILDFIRYTVAADLAQRHRGRYYAGAGVDVERLFASVDLLIDRYDQPWSPFVASWHPGLESFSPVPTLHPSDLFFELNDVDLALKSAIEPRRTFVPMSGNRLKDALGKLVARAIQRARPSDVGTLLTKVRNEMLQSLFDVVRINDPTRVAYLKPLLDLASQQGSVTIATVELTTAPSRTSRRLRVCGATPVSRDGRPAARSDGFPARRFVC